MYMCLDWRDSDWWDVTRWCLAVFGVVWHPSPSIHEGRSGFIHTPFYGESDFHKLYQSDCRIRITVIITYIHCTLKHISLSG